jgi:predicted dehydrogenase
MYRRQFFPAALAAASALPAVPGAKIRTGLLGTAHSHFGGKLKAMLDSPHYEVVAVAEDKPEARARLARDPLTKDIPLRSEADLLGDSSLHLIVVECSVWEALPWGRKVIDAGKHLHIEKPPGNDWAAFKSLVEDARRKNLRLQTGYVWRHNAAASAAIDAAKQGWLGEVFMVRGDMSADRDAAQRAVEARYKGGGLFELAGHVLDRMLEITGRPKTVKSWLRHDTPASDSLADNNLAVFEFDKSLGVISQAAQRPGAGDQRLIEVIGTGGSVTAYPERNQPLVRVHMRSARGPYKAGWQELTLPPQPRFLGDFAELARSIQTGTPLTPGYDHELLLQETLLRASGEKV